MKMWKQRTSKLLYIRYSSTVPYCGFISEGVKGLDLHTVKSQLFSCTVSKNSSLLLIVETESQSVPVVIFAVPSASQPAVLPKRRALSTEFTIQSSWRRDRAKYLYSLCYGITMPHSTMQKPEETCRAKDHGWTANQTVNRAITIDSTFDLRHTINSL